MGWSNASEPSGASLRATLVPLALDLRWTWSHETDEIWERLDASLWGATRNPWVVLQSVGEDRLAELARDEAFVAALQRCVRLRESARIRPTWFATTRANRLRRVVYFSMEFGIAEALPIYSGGLGVLAGDHLKAADDLGVPLAGIGLLYNEGYFRQVLDLEGGQRELYPTNEPDQLPLQPLWDSAGRRMRIPIAFPGRIVWARAWQANVGSVALYLLDCNDALNSPADRGITAQLYGGSQEQRLQQELILGFGGWALVRALDLRPDVCHLNEGHASFAILARAGSFMEENGVPFDVALRATRAGNVFTTHTAVAAAFDRFPVALATKYLTPYAERLGLDVERLLEIGRFDDERDGSFNMAYLALRGSGRVNAVSRLHAEVSRDLFAPVFAGWPRCDVPIGHITNGVHVPSWESRDADALWSRACGTDCWRGDLDRMPPAIASVSDDELWTLRTRNRERAVGQVRDALARRLGAAGVGADRIAQACAALDPAALTLSFARRFTGYKRPGLLLHDPDRLARLLTNRDRPVQLILAGKAHPHDEAGKAAIREWVRFAERNDVWDRVVFLSDYDLALAAILVRGADVWINTPRRPWEASGTSGMKVLVNGGLNVSELDGWWAEAYAPGLGWAVRDEVGEGADRDAHEALQLYARLEDEIVPRFYERNERGIPEGWVRMMRESMSQLVPRFSANRMMRQYVDEQYAAAAAAYRARVADGAQRAAAQEREVRELAERWHELRFVSRNVTATDHGYRLEAVVSLGTIDPNDVRVELFADPGMRYGEERVAMNGANPTPDGLVYTAELPSRRPSADYTARIVPNVEGLATPLECPLILWQR